MSRAELNEEVVFDIARHIEDPDVRKDYVDQACANAPALKVRVNELLKLHDEEASFLESTPESMPPTVEISQVAGKVGQTIGSYTLREQIDEGGMGVVYVAEQEKPLRRKVALKVIKPGMDSKAVLARFDAERNALALMNHPNIAKVLDAGTTEQGHPYFVMELIQGKPITE
jgi:serine/threonine protein kinase